jgi:hypothetical protein
MRALRPFPGRPHVGPPPPDAQPTPHDELRAAPMPGLPATAGSTPTRVLEILSITAVHDDRGIRAGWLMPGELVPVAKGIGLNGTIAHVITNGRHAGRIVYRHRPGYRSVGDRFDALELGGEGPS